MNQSNEDNQSSGFGAGMMLGLVLGVGATLFLQTDSGKKLLKDLKSKTEEAVDELSENELVQQKLEQARQAVLEAKKTLETYKSHSNNQKTSKNKEKRFFTQKSS